MIDHMYLGADAESNLPDEIVHNLEDMGIPLPKPIMVDPTMSIPEKDMIKGINPKDALGALKPDPSVVPPTAELHLASAMMDGARKYGPFNWRDNAVQARVYYAAARRHLAQWLDGEDFDPTSGVHHLGHAMACCAILLDADETGNLVDDRPKPGATGKMIRSWTEEQKFQ